MKKCIRTVQQVIKCCNMPLGIVAILLLLAPQYLFATTFTVSSTADSGPGTLRQAITNANADVNTPHTINFSIAAGSTILLATPNRISSNPFLERISTYINSSKNYSIHENYTTKEIIVLVLKK